MITEFDLENFRIKSGKQTYDELIDWQKDRNIMHVIRHNHCTLQFHEDKCIFVLIFSCLYFLYIFPSEDENYTKINIIIFKTWQKSSLLTLVGYGEEFNIQKHPQVSQKQCQKTWWKKFDFSNYFVQGTEVKAITYSAMKIYDEPDKKEIFCIIDI